MAKDPIFPLYYNDLDRSTKTWTDEEFGAYVRLLMEQWDKGFIPKDYQRLTRIATSLDKNWPLLKSKFVEVDGNLQNIRLEEIRAKKSKFKEKQRNNILNRYQKPTKPPTKKLPLENESENESEIEKGSLEKSEKPFLKLVSVDWQRDEDFQSAYLTWIDSRGDDWREQQHAATMKQLKDFTKEEAITCLLKAIQGNYKTLYPSKENGKGKQNGQPKFTEALAQWGAANDPRWKDR